MSYTDVIKLKIKLTYFAEEISQTESQKNEMNNILKIKQKHWKQNNVYQYCNMFNQSQKKEIEKSTKWHYFSIFDAFFSQ